MFCQKCGLELMRTDSSCPNCFEKRTPLWRNFLIIVMVIFVSGFGSGWLALSVYEQVAGQEEMPVYGQTERAVSALQAVPFTVPAYIAERDAPRQLTEVIAEAQECVYTVSTHAEQGSGFLYNEEGMVVTNAHVVTGADTAQIKTGYDTEYEGVILGKSQYMDVAVIYVEELEDRNPFPLEKSERFNAGEPVIALGSPEGVANTATIGHITDTAESLTIGLYEYEDLYEISARITNGNSGGPLLSKNGEAFIAVNAAKSIHDPAVAYSVPLYKVTSLIDELIADYEG